MTCNDISEDKEENKQSEFPPIKKFSRLDEMSFLIKKEDEELMAKINKKAYFNNSQFNTFAD